MISLVSFSCNCTKSLWWSGEFLSSGPLGQVFPFYLLMSVEPISFLQKEKHKAYFSGEAAKLTHKCSVMPCYSHQKIKSKVMGTLFSYLAFIVLNDKSSFIQLMLILNILVKHFTKHSSVHVLY